ncbi:MAG: methylenetetrahydrofolate--tRNA-(uracil(54)-C(5))-methyltransferase (FADH(2)-oxidizing) TrmFO [Clostridia bacterium]|nr:methylenetetrahydrofolate--tRNA-(uracil(54)-C(5))-methyltransferase (FADH(2)-oxidizing) TrmFO [Clostridia bacterium]
MKAKALVIGAGLSGCEAAFQLAKRGIYVELFEMKPHRKSPAHKSDLLCELVCSNSLRSDRLQNGAGLLKEELRRLGSFVMECADATRIPAGGALAVDREGFSKMVTERLKSEPNIKIVNEEVEQIPDEPCIVATGPLTDGKLLADIEAKLGEGLHFFDAAAPLVTRESLDMNKVFAASRYERGSDYLNCPMNRDEYFAFVRELVNAETAQLHGFEKEAIKVFEGCMPVEVMAKRGEMTLAFGPLKPVGLIDERTGQRPFAVVQLRQDDKDSILYNIVGFQTNLKFPEQKRVFSMIPGLENAEFVRYGVMHRNTYINSPGKLNSDFSTCMRNDLYFAGQITGVEGYIESIASGFVAGISLGRKLLGKEPVAFTNETALGALGNYAANYAGNDFQPMNINFGIMAKLQNPPRNKQERYTQIAFRALAKTDEIKDNI